MMTKNLKGGRNRYVIQNWIKIEGRKSKRGVSSNGGSEVMDEDRFLNFVSTSVNVIYEHDLWSLWRHKGVDQGRRARGWKEIHSEPWSFHKVIR